MVRPMMTVTVTNFDGFTRQQFWVSIFIQNPHLQNSSSEALKICHSNCHHQTLLASGLNIHWDASVVSNDVALLQPCVLARLLFGNPTTNRF